MTEYIIIVAMIAIAAIMVYQYFGSTVRNQTAAIALELSGQSGATNNSKAGTDATKGGTKANTTMNLNQYTGQQAP